MNARSDRPEVRNPVAALDAVQRLQALDAPTKRLIGDAFRALSADSRCRAEKCWRTHKAPMAAYWKAFAVNWRHLSIVVGRPGVRQVKKAEALAMDACRELIRGDGTAESLQRTIDLARQAIGLQ